MNLLASYLSNLKDLINQRSIVMTNITMMVVKRKKGKEMELKQIQMLLLLKFLKN